MTFILADRVKEATSAPGTGTATLTGAALGYRTFSSGIGANNTTYYVIADQGGANWEVGYGTIGAGGTTLARTTVLSSSNAGSLVNFSSGIQDVWCDYPANKAVWLVTNGDISQVVRNISGITGAITSPESITFDTAPAIIPTATGSMYWDAGNKTPSLVLDADVSLQVGQENVALVYNGTGVTITNGSVVAVNGAQGQRPSVALADADSEALSAPTLGIATEDILNGAEGFVTTFGFVRGINTSAFTAGAPIYLSQTAGQFTATRPAAPAHTVALGWVIKVNASSGEVFVNINNGWEISELHDVLISSPTGGQLLAYDQTNSYWKNISLGAGTGFAATAGTGGTLSIGASVAAIGTWMATPSSANLLAAMTNETGTGLLVFNTSPTFVTPLLGTPTSGTLTNCTGLPNAGLVNSSVTFNGVSVALGASGTITATATNALTIGTGLSGTSYNGSAAVTIANTGVLSFSGGTTGLTPSTATTGAVTLAGTLAVANGGTGATTAAAARTNLGATTVGGNFFTLANPTAITFPRINADNTVSALDAATFRTAIGAGTSSTTGTVTSVSGTGTVNGLTLTGTVTSSGSLTLGGTLAIAASQITSGTLAIARGGTNSTATPTAGGAAYGTGSAFAFTAAGTAGQVLTSQGASAPTWTALPTNAVTRTEATATAGQTTFSVTYTVGLIYVFQNGALLGTADYTATNGTSVVLATGATAGDLLTFEVYAPLSLGSTTGSGSVVLQTSPTLVTPNLGIPASGDLVNCLGSVPAGAVQFFAMNTAPNGFIKANGAAVSRTTYSRLFTAIGTTFGAGDGSTTFNVPDMRGYFPRGWVDNGSVDSGRAFGSTQTDAFQGHKHSSDGSSLYGTPYPSGTLATTGGGGAFVAVVIGNPTTDGTNGTPRTSSETRPSNVALLACIKY